VPLACEAVNSILTSAGPATLAVVVAACTNLINLACTSPHTITLINGSFYFSDPQWTNYPNRHYSLQMPSAVSGQHRRFFNPNFQGRVRFRRDARETDAKCKLNDDNPYCSGLNRPHFNHLPCADVCGEDPIAQGHSQKYNSIMNTLLIIVVLVLLFGGGGGYYYSRRR